MASDVNFNSNQSDKKLAGTEVVTGLPGTTSLEASVAETLNANETGRCD